MPPNFYQTANEIKRCNTNTFLIFDFVMFFIDPIEDIRRVENGYECTICGKIMKQRNNLKRHIRDKHSEDDTIFICKYCFKSYKSKNSLDNHVSLYHKDEKGLLDAPEFLCDS